MDAILVFGPENEHPFAWLLDKKYRHVWCIIADERAKSWVSYDWHQGLPRVRAEAELDFDILAHYNEQGLNAIKVTYEPKANWGPLVLNNCVGHVKSVLGIQSWAVTPLQLFKWATRDKSISRSTLVKRFFSFPGFGGSPSPPAPPPPPPPPPPAPKKTDISVQQARADEIKRAKLRTGQAGTIKTPGLLDPADTAYKTLLG